MRVKGLTRFPRTCFYLKRTAARSEIRSWRGLVSDTVNALEHIRQVYILGVVYHYRPGARDGMDFQQLLKQASANQSYTQKKVSYLWSVSLFCLDTLKKNLFPSLSFLFHLSLNP